MKVFCPNCEVEMKLTKASNPNIKGNGWIAECSMCSMAMTVDIFRSPVKTYDQVTEDFNKIPLTDSQRGSKAKKRCLIPKQK